MSHLSSFALLLLISCAGPAFGAIFQCVGQDGVVVFSQIACGTDARSIIPVVQTMPPMSDSAKAWLKQRERRQSASKVKHKPRTIRKSTPSKAEERRCLRKREQLAELKARLRRGYKAGQGPKLKRRRAEYQRYLDDFCE